MDGKFAFPAASNVGLEDEVIACCCSRDIKTLLSKAIGRGPTTGKSSGKAIALPKFAE